MRKVVGVVLFPQVCGGRTVHYSFSDASVLRLVRLAPFPLLLRCVVRRRLYPFAFEYPRRSGLLGLLSYLTGFNVGGSRRQKKSIYQGGESRRS